MTQIAVKESDLIVVFLTKYSCRVCGKQLHDAHAVRAETKEHTTEHPRYAYVCPKCAWAITTTYARHEGTQMQDEAGTVG